MRTGLPRKRRAVSERKRSNGKQVLPGDRMSDLSTIHTADLVYELCSRDGIESHSISESYYVSIIHEIEALDPVEVYGPARIIVVQGVE